MPPTEPQSHDDWPRPPVDQGFEAVTPAIPSGRTDYNSQAAADAPSYFSRADPLIPRADPDELILPQSGGSNPAAAMARRESLSDIRASNPDLALTGNIISATFTIPHSFAYRKGGDWVSPMSQWLSVAEIGFWNNS